MHSNLNYLNKLKPHKKIIILKSVLSKVSVYWAYNRICVPTTTRLLGNRAHSPIPSKGPLGHGDPWLNEITGNIEIVHCCCHSPEIYEWALKTRVSIVYQQLKFYKIRNDYLTPKLAFLALVDLKTINF